MAEGKRKPQYAMQVLETSARRGVDMIAMDGRVRNIGEKPVKGLVILFDFLGTDGQVVTTQRFEVDQDIVEPGQDATFRGKLMDPVRAVRYRMNATDSLGRDFKVSNPGPFVID